MSPKEISACLLLATWKKQTIIDFSCKYVLYVQLLGEKGGLIHSNEPTFKINTAPANLLCGLSLPYTLDKI